MRVPHTVVATAALGSSSDLPDDILQQLPLAVYEVDAKGVSSTLRRVILSVCDEESYHRRVVGSGDWSFI